MLYISNSFQLAADAVFPEMMRIGKSKTKVQSLNLTDQYSFVTPKLFKLLSDPSFQLNAGLIIMYFVTALTCPSSTLHSRSVIVASRKLGRMKFKFSLLFY